MKLSVVIASHNEPDIGNTVASIRATAGSSVEVIVVDDFSDRPPVPALDATVLRNGSRLGCGQSRRVGVEAATGDWVLIVDSHSRFLPGWYEALSSSVGDDPQTLWCGVCLGLGKKQDGKMNMDVEHPNGSYFGATWNFFGRDRKNNSLRQVFENVWAEERDGDGYELSAIMGACYCLPREWYLKLNCGVNLLSYGCDEQELSLKTWLAGGRVRICKALRVGHKFMGAPSGPSSFFSAETPKSDWYVVRNKLFLIHSLLPEDKARRLVSKFFPSPSYGTAAAHIRTESAAIKEEKRRFGLIQSASFEEFMEKFRLDFPAA